MVASGFGSWLAADFSWALLLDKLLRPAFISALNSFSLASLFRLWGEAFSVLITCFAKSESFPDIIVEITIKSCPDSVNEVNDKGIPPLAVNSYFR